MTEYIRIFWEKKRQLEGLNHISKSKIFNLNDGEICYDDTGENTGKSVRKKPVVICLPGAGDMRTQFRCTTPMLYASGYRVISVDIRGIGNSSTTWKTCTVSDVANDIEALCAHLKINMHRGIVLMVHGESAAVALLLASKRIDLVRCIVFISPILKSNQNPLGVTEKLKHSLFPNWCVNTWFKYYQSLFGDDKSMLPLDHEKYLEMIRDQMKDPNRYSMCIKYMASPKELALGKLTLIRCPIYLARGNTKRIEEFDKNLNFALEMLKEYVPIIESKVYNCGHFIHIESSYEFGNDVSNWIDRNYIPIWKEKIKNKESEEKGEMVRPKLKKQPRKKKRKFKFVQRQ